MTNCCSVAHLYILGDNTETMFITNSLSFSCIQGAIKDAVNVEEQPKPTAQKGQKAGWLTLAAMGVGAMVVGALAIR